MSGQFGSGRTTGGISGSGGKNINPTYKEQRGGRMGPAKIQGPQIDKKKKPSVVDKIKKVFSNQDTWGTGSPGFIPRKP